MNGKSHLYTSSASSSLTSLRAFICSPVKVLMQILFLLVVLDVFFCSPPKVACANRAVAVKTEQCGF